MDVVIFGAGGHGQDIAATVTGGVSFMDDDPVKVIGVNDSSTRRRLAHKLKWTGGQWVHPAANVGPRVTLGEHTHVNAGAFLTRCTLGDFCTVGPNATICGDVTIGDGVSIGAGAVIRNLLSIGDGATIGAGAVVVKDVEPGVTVVGNPARPL